MVRIPRPPGGKQPELTYTMEVPNAEVDTISVTIQQTNQPQQLPKHPNREATLHAPASNAGTVYFGGSKVNAEGFPLNPNAAQDTHVDDLSKLWIFGTKNDVIVIEVEWGIGEV